jgi:DNA invertase Pin-like site-specific DNA recombinase
MGKLKGSIPQKDIDVILSFVNDGIRIAGGVEELAAAIGVSRITIWAWKNKQYLPRGSHMMALMAFCHI